jgi:hypothetical protein
LHVSEAQSVLETNDPVERLAKINEIIKTWMYLAQLPQVTYVAHHGLIAL